MNLQLRPMDDGRTMVLTDHRGVMLPGQRTVRWEHGGPGEYPSALFEFIVDGFEIEVVPAPAIRREDRPLLSLPEVAEGFAGLSPENRRRFLTMYGLAEAPR